MHHLSVHGDTLTQVPKYNSSYPQFSRMIFFRVFPQLSYAAPESLWVTYVACAFSNKFQNSIPSLNEQVRAYWKTIKIALELKALKH